MKRSPSQKLAVATVRKAAKQMIEEIDKHHDPLSTEFTAYFHLDRWRVEQRPIWGHVGEIRYGSGIFKSVDARMSNDDETTCRR